MAEVRKVFYSWQSDLDSKGNRYLIRDILKKNIKEINNNEEKTAPLELDSDTRKISGSPDIVDIILKKVSESSVFVCDITIINSASDGKKNCNPNVLFELGYAIAKLGWEKVICVFNTYYGKVETLPFDLRNRRHLTYYYDPERSKKEQKTDVQKLESGLMHAVGSITGEDDLKVGVRFRNGEKTAETKVLIVSEIRGVDINERRTNLQSEGIKIHKAIVPKLIIGNLGSKPLKDYRIKLIVKGDVYKIGDKQQFSFPRNIEFISKLKFRNDRIVIYQPDEKLLVPKDGFEIDNLGIISKGENPEETIEIGWQILSEECFDKGSLILKLKNKFLTFVELEAANRSNSIDEKIILEKEIS